MYNSFLEMIGKYSATSIGTPKPSIEESSSPLGKYLQHLILPVKYIIYTINDSEKISFGNQTHVATR